MSTGKRGLSGGTTLARFLEEHCGARVGVERRGRLDLEQILVWADAYHQRRGHWPTRLSGPISESRRDTWHGVGTSGASATRNAFRPKADDSTAHELEAE